MSPLDYPIGLTVVTLAMFGLVYMLVSAWRERDRY